MRINRDKFLVCILLVFTCFFVVSNQVVAHDLWLNVDNHYPKIGEKTAVRVVFGHNFPHYDILLSRDKLAGFFYLCPDGRTKEIEKTWEDRKGERKGALVGEIALDREGTYLVTAFMKRKGDREHVPSEKYGKSIIVVGKGDGIVSKPFGHRIEIIPLKNPSKVKPGSSLPVKVLFEGKPLSTYVYATYAGYYSEDKPFPIVTKSNKEGVASVRISRAGIWKIVANHEVNFSSTLTFEIK